MRISVFNPVSWPFRSSSLRVSLRPGEWILSHWRGWTTSGAIDPKVGFASTHCGAVTTNTSGGFHLRESNLLGGTSTEAWVCGLHVGSQSRFEMWAVRSAFQRAVRLVNCDVVQPRPLMRVRDFCPNRRAVSKTEDALKGTRMALAQGATRASADACWALQCMPAIPQNPRLRFRARSLSISPRGAWGAPEPREIHPVDARRADCVVQCRKWPLPNRKNEFLSRCQCQWHSATR